MEKTRRKLTAQEMQERWQWLLARLTPDMSRALYRQALRICGSAEGAEDMMQETVLRAVERMEQLRREDCLMLWLTVMLRRMALDERERREREGAACGRWLREQPCFAPPAERDAMERELIRRMEDTLQGLSAFQRRTVLLRLRDGLTYRGIAKRCRKSVSVVYGGYQRGIARVRGEMAKELQPAEESTQSRGHTV